MAAVTTKAKILTPISTPIHGVVLVDVNQKPVAAVPLGSSWIPADGDKITITYKPQR